MNPHRTHRQSRLSPNRISLAALFAAILFSGAAALSSPAAAEPAYLAPWTQALERYTASVPQTVGTTVDYQGLRRGEGARLWKQVLQELGRAEAPRTRAEKLAFWSNAYNILAIDTVLRAWPVESIRDVGSFFNPVWKHEAGRAAGRTVTLHEVEHEILRPLGDARIHAAIVCASTSCPSLRRTPFHPETIETELDEQMRSFLTSETKGLRIDRARRSLTVSRIFDWFEEDFESQGGIRGAVTRYAPEADRAWLEKNAAGASLSFFDYDWTVNTSSR